MPVNSRHPNHQKHAGQWKRCRDAAKGQDAVHQAGAVYLPMLGGQTDAEYTAYKMRASFYGATRRTIDGLSGMLFRKPMEVKTSIDDILGDVTRDGQSLLNFAEEAAEEMLQVGKLGILIDHPPMAAVLTMAEAQAARMRPYMRLYTAESILNWRYDDGILRMVVLEEKAEVDSDGYTCKTVDQWRVLRLEEGRYYQQLFQKNDKGDFIQIGADIYPIMQGKYLSYIPFVFANERNGKAEANVPPLMPLVDVNLSHYRTTADYEHGLHWCGCPTAVITGHSIDDGETLAIGSGNAWVFPEADAKATMLELKAESLGAIESALTRKESQMAALGARMLAPDKKMVESAEAASIHRGGEISVLSSMAMSLSEALERSLDMIAEWLGRAQGSVAQINRDYLPAGMSAQDIQVRVQAWQAGGISHQELYDELVAGEVIRVKDGGFEAEKERIDETPPGMTGSMNGG